MNSTKFCKKCKHTLPITEFKSDKRSSDGLYSFCKPCCKIYMDNYRIQHKDEIRKQRSTYRVNNDELVKASRRKWYHNNKARAKLTHQKWIDNNRDYVRNQRHDYHMSHKEETKLYSNSKYRNDLKYRLAKNLRSRIRLAIKGFSKNERSSKLLGCTIEELRRHIESKFKDGMSWDNYGRGFNKWHIDHIIPCAVFDLSDPVEQKQCFHYTNLQPLWEPENQSKGCKCVL